MTYDLRLQLSQERRDRFWIPAVCEYVSQVAAQATQTSGGL